MNCLILSLEFIQKHFQKNCKNQQSCTFKVKISNKILNIGFLKISMKMLAQATKFHKKMNVL